MTPNYLIALIPSMVTSFFFLIFVIVIAELILKGITLWKSARNNQPVWFLVILIFNTAGILPLIYLLLENRTGVNNKQYNSQKKSNRNTKRNVKPKSMKKQIKNKK